MSENLIPAPIIYFLKQMENSKNKNEKYEYFIKLREIENYIHKSLDKYKLEFPGK